MANQHHRIVTGHNKSGKAIIKIDDYLSGNFTPTKDAILTSAWGAIGFPHDCEDEKDGRDYIGALGIENGSVLRLCTMMPHSRSPMHRTQTLDYGIVIKGEIYLELDDGTEAKLKSGDVAIQRGTIHAWVNKSDEEALIAFVLIGAKPIFIDGQKLEPTHLEGVK